MELSRQCPTCRRTKLRKVNFFGVCLSVCLISGFLEVSRAQQARGREQTQAKKAEADKAAAEKTAADKAAADKAKARALLMSAEKHDQRENYSNAEKSILDAIATAPNDSEISKAADSKW